MKALRDLDARHGGEARQWELTCAAARYLATAMAYDDVIRVADLKTRATRFERDAPGSRRASGPAGLHHRIHAPAPGKSAAPCPPGWAAGWKLKAFGGFVERRLGKPPHAQRHAGRLPDAVRAGRHATLPPRHAAPPDREGRPGAMAGSGRAARAGLCAGRGNGQLPSPGEGLQRHPRARRRQIPPAARGRRETGRPPRRAPACARAKRPWPTRNAAPWNASWPTSWRPGLPDESRKRQAPCKP